MLETLRKLLLPLSWVYGGGVWLRNSLYDWKLLPSYLASLPVICVGNVSVGGSGKTPFVIFLAGLLCQNGLRPVILLRGYRGNEKGPLILDSLSAPEKVGDEAVVHFRHFEGCVPVVIARDRSAGARLIEAQKLGDVIILDDGYQHRRLRRDINILLLDREDGELLPAGNLREPVASAVKRADFVIGKGPYGVRTEALDFVDLALAEHLPLELLRGKEVTVVTAIARPERFIASLQELGLRPGRTYLRRDHHQFSLSEWNSLLAADANPIVVTEKDAVKLSGFKVLPGKVFVLRIASQMTSGAEKLCELLSQRLRRSIVSTPETPSSARVMFSS